MADVTMPQLGETVTEGTITKWFKQVGDKVEEDEALFEVSTDKVDSEVPASTSGYLAEILVKEGETVDVGAKLAVISDQPAGAGGGDANGQGAAAEPEAPPAEGKAEADGDVADGDGAAEDEAQAAEPEPEPKPEAKSAPKAAPATADAPTSAPAPARSTTGGGDGAGQTNGPRRVLSPVVRRLIAEHDLDPDHIAGTGYQNRITRDDVLAHLDRGAAGAAPRPAAASAPAAAKEAPAAARPAATVPATAGAGADQVLPFSNIRRRTAEHMVRSLDTSAHVLTVIEVDFDNVDRVRQAAKGKWKADEGSSLTYLPFVSRAVIDAIRDFPHVNASVDGDSLVVHQAVNLGFAVDLNFEGLIVPVIHDADAKRMRSLARELADLAARARAKKLNADEIQGGTFTITNPGGYGTLLTAPVINQPQVAILSTDGVKKRPVVVELPDGSDAIAIHPVGNLALSFDHRAFDGAYASAFIARVRDILETRDWSQEL
ncbi:MAG: hypothetical protein QOG82_2261 [Actinomycetota bacterium]|jgi:2-oxoglutarate dehydrogenase E2 component (dihydrolipoamide succinyltransferase)|nr:hypothetical protein [Actinomycetota bacterium]